MFATRFLFEETSFLTEQLCRTCVRYDHDHHRQVERYQGTETGERVVVDDAVVGFGHDIYRIVQTCNEFIQKGDDSSE